MAEQKPDHDRAQDDAKRLEKSGEAHTEKARGESDKSLSQLGQQIKEHRKKQHETGKSGATDPFGLNSAKDLLGDHAKAPMVQSKDIHKNLAGIEAARTTDQEGQKSEAQAKYETATQTILESARQRFGKEKIDAMHIAKDDMSTAVSALLLGPDVCRQMGPDEASKFGKRVIVFGVAPMFGMNDEAQKHFSKENLGNTAHEAVNNFLSGTAIGALLERAHPLIAGGAMVGGGALFVNDQVNNPQHKARNEELSHIASKVDRASNDELVQMADRSRKLIGPEVYNGAFTIATAGAGIPEGKALHAAAREDAAKAVGKIETKDLINTIKNMPTDAWDAISAMVKGVPREQVAAERILSGARAAEEHTTKDLCQLAEKSGGEMIGLNYRLKSQDSLQRKLRDGEHPSNINDALRYTMSFPPGKLAAGATHTIAEMEKMGYTKEVVKNTFEPDSVYMGINCTFSKGGQRFELQFHTPESFHVKDVQNHKLYEVYRELFTKNAGGETALKPTAETEAVANKYSKYLQDNYPQLAEMGRQVQQGGNARGFGEAILEQMKLNSSKIEMPNNIQEVKRFRRKA